jgi:hypothetical protein
MFCQWFLQQCSTNPNFPAFVIFTDEAQFTRDGNQNFHNLHLWADENPHVNLPTSELVCGVIIYSDPTYFLIDLQGGITQISWKTTCLISWPTCHSAFIKNCTSCTMVLPHIPVSSAGT